MPPERSSAARLNLAFTGIVSFVLDMPLVPCCQSAEVGGLDYDELEVNPLLDVASGTTSLLAAQLILEFLGQIVDNPALQARHPAARNC